MAKVLVLYHSMYGHIEAMAAKIAEGARSVAGTEVTIKRVPETMPAEAFKAAGGKAEQAAAVASPAELADYDAIIFGTPTRFGNMSGQMRSFLDQTGGLWAKGALAGKVGSVFTSTGTLGGQETTVTSFWNTLAHHGMVIVPAGFPVASQFDLSQVKGGSPYGAATVAGADHTAAAALATATVAAEQSGSRAVGVAHLFDQAPSYAIRLSVNRSG